MGCDGLDDELGFLKRRDGEDNDARWNLDGEYDDGG